MFIINNKLNKIAFGIGILVLFSGCQKIVHGYISDNIYYQVNPFEVQQGITTVSSSLILNGSTAPLHVKITSLTDSIGNNADSILIKPQKIVTFKGTITNADSTLDLLNAKLGDSLVSPFNIAEIGGRLQFTAATAYVPAGTYNLGLRVSNVNGARDIPNACKIIVVPLADPSNVSYVSYRVNDSTGTTQLSRYDNNSYYMSVDIERTATLNESKIILKFVDTKGVPFNPSKGEVSDWSQSPASTTSFPQLHYWAPYYPMVYTDTAIIQQLPNVNITFPYYNLNSTYGASGGARFDSKIKGLKSGLVLHTAIYFYLYTIGTYTITVHLNQDEHK